MNIFSIAMTAFSFLTQNGPVLEQMLKTAEVTFNVPQAGKDKLDYVLAELKAFYSGGQAVASSIPWEALLPFLNRNIAAKVKVLFPKSTAPQGAQVSA